MMPLEWTEMGRGLLSLVWILGFIGFLFVLFSAVSDAFHDHTLQGWQKALWIALLVLLPFPTVLVYLVVRGPSMQLRQHALARSSARATHALLSGVAHPAPAAEIAQAQALLDAGHITRGEFETLKRHALSPFEPMHAYGDA